MSQPWILLIGIVALAALYVLLPVAWDAYRRFRGARAVRCPATAARADVELDAGRAALTALFRHPAPRVARCTEWPRRQGCAQGCLAEAAPAVAPLPGTARA